jgi:hypothetical protein
MASITRYLVFRRGQQHATMGAMPSTTPTMTYPSGVSDEMIIEVTLHSREENLLPGLAVNSIT